MFTRDDDAVARPGTAADMKRVGNKAVTHQSQLRLLLSSSSGSADQQLLLPPATGTPEAISGRLLLDRLRAAACTGELSR